MKNIQNFINEGFVFGYATLGQAKYVSVVRLGKGEDIEADISTSLSNLKLFLTETFENDEVKEIMKLVKNLNAGQCMSWGENKDYIVISRLK